MHYAKKIEDEAAARSIWEKRRSDKESPVCAKSGVTAKRRWPKKMGIVRVLVSDYEKGRLRPHPEMVARFALVFGVTTDEIIGLKPSDGQGHEPNLAIQKRMRLIEQLPTAKRRVILQTIDAFIKGVE